jgi:hypothetical protein
VTANLADLPEELIQRRVYMLMVQGEQRAEVRVFERFDLDDTDTTLGTWSDDSLGDLMTQLTEVLVANKGVHCPGEQVKATLTAEREFSMEGPFPAPTSAAEAFGPALAGFGGDRFVHATVALLC